MARDKVRLGLEAGNILESLAMQTVAKDIKDMLYKEFETLEDTPEGERRTKALKAQAWGMSEIRGRLQRMVDEGVIERDRQQAAEEAVTDEGEAA